MSSNSMALAEGRRATPLDSNVKGSSRRHRFPDGQRAGIVGTAVDSAFGSRRRRGPGAAVSATLVMCRS